MVHSILDVDRLALLILIIIEICPQISKVKIFIKNGVHRVLFELVNTCHILLAKLINPIIYMQIDILLIMLFIDLFKSLWEIDCHLFKKKHFIQIEDAYDIVFLFFRHLLYVYLFHSLNYLKNVFEGLYLVLRYFFESSNYFILGFFIKFDSLFFFCAFERATFF